jgi:putative heme-binding domain-containing protein
LGHALVIAEMNKLPQLADWIRWFAAVQQGEGLDRIITSFNNIPEPALHRNLSGLWLAIEPTANVRMPSAWKKVAPVLYASKAPEVQRLTEQLAAAFGDDTAFPRLRETLADTRAEKGAREHALAVLSRAQDRASLPVFLKLLDEGAFRSAAIRLLARFDLPEIPGAVLQRFRDYNPAERTAALEALSARPTYAVALLDAVVAGKVPRDQLTAFHVARLAALKNPEVDKRVTATWGRVQQTPIEKQAQIGKLEKSFNEAPLWAYSANAGKIHFQKLCVQCHRLGNEGARLGPELTGAGKHGIRYFLENIIDPDAVVGTDFQATTIDTKEDETLTGLLVSETQSAVTLRTTVGDTVIPKSGIKARTTSQKSLMPEGLLNSLGDREQIELLKFLTTN